MTNALQTIFGFVQTLEDRLPFGEDLEREEMEVMKLVCAMEECLSTHKGI